MPNDLTAAPTDLHWLTIADAARLIERRRLSPVELTRCAARPHRGARPAAQRLSAADAGEGAASRRERPSARSWRAAIAARCTASPSALKDIYATAGIRTTGHSKICEDIVPTEDATTVAKLYQAGAVLLGKLATHEFAHGGPSFDLPWPPARNPWNRDALHRRLVERRRAPRSPPGLCPARSAPIPAARSAARPRSAASSG